MAIKTQLWTPDTEGALTIIQEVDTDANTVTNVGYIKDGEAVYKDADSESKASAKFKDKYRKNKRVDSTIVEELSDVLTVNQYKNKVVVPLILIELPTNEKVVNNQGVEEFKTIPNFKRNNKGLDIDIDTKLDKTSLNNKLPSDVKVIL